MNPVHVMLVKQLNQMVADYNDNKLEGFITSIIDFETYVKKTVGGLDGLRAINHWINNN